MSGHSKWATIKRAKGKTDAARSNLFTKIGREIAVTVKSGGADPNSNARLRDVIAKAKQNNMPNDNITRSIKKASGELGSINFEEIKYEGYGIGGSAVIVRCLTDNKNRTAGDVRHGFDKYGGSLGSTGCVSYMFENKGIIIIEKTSLIKEDDLVMLAIDAGADDLISESDVYEIITTQQNFASVKDKLEKEKFDFINAEVTLVPQNYVDLEPDKLATFIKMIDFLNDLDDVQDVYHNVNIPENEDGG